MRAAGESRGERGPHATAEGERFAAMYAAAESLRQKDREPEGVLESSARWFINRCGTAPTG